MNEYSSTQRVPFVYIGQRIFEEEQQGKDRADYGTYLTRNIAKSLEPEYGSGFGVRQLEQARLFYRTYPNANTLRSQLYTQRVPFVYTGEPPLLCDFLN